MSWRRIVAGDGRDNGHAASTLTFGDPDEHMPAYDALPPALRDAFKVSIVENIDARFYLGLLERGQTVEQLLERRAAQDAKELRRREELRARGAYPYEPIDGRKVLAAALAASRRIRAGRN